MNLFKFLGEVKNEIDKVTWPTRNETVTLTIIVVIISVIVGLYLGGLDLLFTEMLKFLVS
jgi:preprotein translocase subunit SecE